ncbi:MAG: hypothetical protein R2695_12730 [Acidimicrobiales bacterium]
MACALLAWSSHFGDSVTSRPEAPASERLAAIFRRAARAFEREPRAHDTLLQVQASRDPHAGTAFAEFAACQMASFEAAIDDVPSADRGDIAMIMSAVLSEALRGRQAGTCSQADVYARLDRAAELVTAGLDAGSTVTTMPVR